MKFFQVLPVFLLSVASSSMASSSSKGKSTKSPGSSKSSKTDSPVPRLAKPFYPFISGALDVRLDMEAIHSTVEKLEGNLEGRYEEKKDPMLSLDQCVAIRDYTDQRWKEDKDAGLDVAQGKNYTLDYRIELEPEQLSNLIGVASIQELYHAFQDYDEDYPVSRIVVRRTTSSHEHHIQYHNDGPTAVMHLWLNAPTEIEGGGLWYLTNNGIAVVDTSITGAASFHSEGIVHGVSNFAGTRYILIFLSDHMEATDIVAPFLEKQVNRMHETGHSEL